MHLVGLEKLRKPMLVRLVAGDTIVANERVRKAQYLPAVARIRQRLRISNHARVEDNFSSCGNIGTEGKSRHARAVLENERSRRASLHEGGVQLFCTRR